MTESMFLPHELDFSSELEKLAAREARLSDQVDNWPQEILQEAYKQSDFISDFQPEVHIVEQDPERGYAFGYIQVANRTEDTRRPTEAALRDEIGVNTARIIVVVKNKRLQPLDLYIQGDRILPLTEERFRSSMFRPQTFDTAKKGPGDTSMVSLLYPPYRQNYGFGGGGQVLKADQVKTSSVRPEFLLDAIRDTIHQQDLEMVEESLTKNAALRNKALHNPAVLPFLMKLSSVQPDTGKDRLRSALESIPPDVVQFSLSDDGYEVKTANSRYWYPETSTVSRAGMLKMASEDVVRRVEQDGSVTISTTPTVRKTELQDDEVFVAKSFGQYKVKTVDGQEVLGWVWPNCTDYDGTILPLAVFTNGSQSAVQDSIVGNYVGQGSNVIRKDRPGGFGVFGREAHGRVTITAPIHIDSVSVSDGSRRYTGTTILGEPVTLVPLKGVTAIQKISDRAVGLPGDVFWIPLNGSTQLVSDADAFVKMAHVRDLDRRAELVSDGTFFSLRGRPFDKLASAQRENIPAADAVFLMASGGVPPKEAEYAVKLAAQLGTYSLVANPIRPLSEQLHQAKLAAAKLSETVPLKEWKADLLKEAATLTDPNTVDRVLSLGFLNDENITTFVDYLPEIDRTIEKLSEMLVGSRLGMEEVPQGALERSLRQLDKVASGLRRLMYATPEEDAA